MTSWKYSKMMIRLAAVDEADDVFGAPVGPLPSVPSNINQANFDYTKIKHDLWIVGAGTLGEIVAKEWKRLHSEDIIVAETRSTSRHEKLTSYGVNPRLRVDRTDNDTRTARNVIICIPPYSSTAASDQNQYISELSDACQLWAGPLGGGSLVFTSSVSVYGDSFGNIVDENFRLDTRSLKATK